MLIKYITLCALLAVEGTALAASGDGALHSIVNVDLPLSEAAAGEQILLRYIRLVRKFPGARSAQLIQQSAEPNHFIIDEVFDSSAAYEAFIGSSGAKALRNELYPHLGSPWDERIGREVKP